jgi:hypothetical protein
MEEWQMQFLIVGVAEQCTGACRRITIAAPAAGWATRAPEFASPGACPRPRKYGGV